MRSRFILVLLGALVLLVVPGAGCSPPRQYKAEPIDGRVVDASTKQPIEGVVVVAEWRLRHGLMGGGPETELEVRETVTGLDGSYHIEGWGPVDFRGHFQGYDPRLVFFKPGYEFKSLRNSLSPPGAGSPMYDPNGSAWSVWSRWTIELQPEPPSYANAHRALETLYPPFKGEACLWKKMPRLLAMLVTATASANDGGDRRTKLMLEIMNGRTNQAQCGSVEQFIRGFL